MLQEITIRPAKKRERSPLPRALFAFSGRKDDRSVSKAPAHPSPLFRRVIRDIRPFVEFVMTEQPKSKPRGRWRSLFAWHKEKTP